MVAGIVRLVALMSSCFVFYVFYWDCCLLVVGGVGGIGLYFSGDSWFFELEVSLRLSFVESF